MMFTSCHQPVVIFVAGPSVWNSRPPHVCNSLTETIFCSKLKTRLLALPGFYYALMNFVRMALSNYNCIVLIKWRYTYSNDSGNERSLRPLGPKSMETEQGTRERALVVLGVEPCAGRAAAANNLWAPPSPAICPRAAMPLLVRSYFCCNFR